MHYKEIQTYDLHSYSQELQKNILDGYRVLTETIYFPQQVGSVYMATLGKEEKDIGVLTDATVFPADPKPVRKKKAASDE